MTEEQTGHEGLINWSAALGAAGDDEALLLDLVRVFLEEATTLMADIRRSISQRDAVLLRRSAHTLKGSLRIFDSAVASDLAFQLEEMGKNSAFDNAPSVLADLEPQMERVVGVMKARLAQ
ncbi:MAG: Hpt domain-containing protein [Candidatus Anammoximicrobium sp.]|nr:Hpt domain-containing protein [Candidatus Anammoximicrobium sp.]